MEKEKQTKPNTKKSASPKKTDQYSIMANIDYNQVLFTGSPIPLVIIDPQTGAYVDFNDAALRIYGIYGIYSREELIGKNTLAFSASTQYDGSDSISKRKEYIQVCLEKGFVNFEWRHQKPDGTQWDAEVHLSTVQIDGKPFLLYSLQDITERKKTEQALRESEEKYRKLFDAESDAIFLIDNQTGQIQEANLAASSMYGYSQEELRTRKNTDLSAEPDQTQKATQEKIASIPVRWHHRKDGTVFPVEINATHLVWKGRPMHIAAIRDITERLRRENEIKEKEQDYRIIFDSVPLMIWYMDPDGKILQANKTAAEVMDIPVEKLIGLTHYDLFNRQEADRFLADNQEVIRSARGKFGIIESYTTQEGNTRWVQTDKVPHYDQNGKATGVFIFVNDITARKQAELALQDSEERFRILVEQAPEAIAVYDVDQRSIVEVNSNAEILFGANRDTLISSKIEPYYYHVQPDGRSISESMDEHIIKALMGETVVFDRTIINAAGKIVECEERLVKLPASDRRLLRASYIDISARKRAEKALQNSQQMLRTVLDTFPGQIFWKDRNSIFMGCNKPFAISYGLGEPENVVGISEFDLNISREEAESFIKDDQKVMESGIGLKGMIEQFREPDGRISWFDKIKLPMMDEDGNIIGVVGVSHDITDRINAEAEIRSLNATLEQRVAERTRELESTNRELRELSYTIAHNLRQPLRAMDAFSHILLEENNNKLDESGREHLARVRKASTHMAQLIDDLLLLLQVTRREFVSEKVNLSRFAFDIIHEKQTLFPQRKFTFICPEQIMVWADPGMIRIVIAALLDNAWKFTYRTAQPVIEMGIDNNGDTPVYFVRDNGIGINMEFQHKLFGAFERLLPVDELGELDGTGIGLAMTQRIIQRHGGEIRIESELKKGTTVFFTLGKTK
jgi:PAS domain S-box-containing protein